MAGSRKILNCERCGRPVMVGVEVWSAICWKCLLGTVHEETGTKGGSVVQTVLSTKAVNALGPFVSETCPNYRLGTGCVQCGGECVVLLGRPCSILEKSIDDPRFVPVVVRKAYPTPALVTAVAFFRGRVCQDCGAPVRRQKRVCDSCRRLRRRGQWRKGKARQRRAKVVGVGQGA